MEGEKTKVSKGIDKNRVTEINELICCPKCAETLIVKISLQSNKIY